MNRSICSACSRARCLKISAPDLIERTIDIVRQTLQDAQLGVDDIEEVVLVGGMTRVPKIQSVVASYFAREPDKGVHPDEVVALGAAIRRVRVDRQKNRNGASGCHATHAWAILTVGGAFRGLIQQNTTVPTSRSEIFTTSRDNQTAVKIIVMQGESERGEENELLGEFVLTGLRKAPKGQVEISVTFEINADGIVSVSAKDLETGQEQVIQVTASSGLTPQELSQMITDAKEEMLERRLSEEEEAVRQEVQRLVAEVERLFPQVEQIVASSDFGRDATAKAKAVLQKARQSLQAQDIPALREHAEALGRTARMFRGVVQRSK